MRRCLNEIVAGKLMQAVKMWASKTKSYLSMLKAGRTMSRCLHHLSCRHYSCAFAKWRETVVFKFRCGQVMHRALARISNAQFAAGWFVWKEATSRYEGPVVILLREEVAVLRQRLTAVDKLISEKDQWEKERRMWERRKAVWEEQQETANEVKFVVICLHVCMNSFTCALGSCKYATRAESSAS